MIETQEDMIARKLNEIAASLSSYSDLIKTGRLNLPDVSSKIALESMAMLDLSDRAREAGE